MNDEHLSHHGILGMKWGVKRFQNRDGSLTSAGRRRYDVGGKMDTNSKNVSSTTKRVNKYGDLTKTRNGPLSKMIKEKSIKKENAKDKSKFNPESKRQQYLKEKYIKEGLLPKEAEKAAYERAKCEKMVAIASVTTIGAAAAYIAYNKHKYKTDIILDNRTKLKNISAFDPTASSKTRDVERPLYAAFKSSDADKYTGWYGTLLKQRDATKDIYQTTYGIKGKAKIASHESGRKAMQNLLKDPENKKLLEQHFELSLDRYKHPGQRKGMKTALDEIRNGKPISKEAYEALNISLVDHGIPTSETVNKKFYNKLKEMGYQGITDINDQKYSGYKTKNPTIFFDSSVLNTEGSRKVSTSEMVFKAGKEGAKRGIEETAKLLGITTGVTAGIAATEQMVRKTAIRKKIGEYRKEHPNSNKTYEELEKMIAKEKGYRM